MAKKLYPGGFRLTLAKARALAVQEFGTAKGLEVDRATCLEGYFRMELGNLHISIRPDMGMSGCIELIAGMSTAEAFFGKDYNLTLTGTAYTVDLWTDGLAMTATLAKMGDVTATAAWEDLKTTMADMSASLYNLLTANGHGDKFATVNMSSASLRIGLAICDVLKLDPHRFVPER